MPGSETIEQSSNGSQSTGLTMALFVVVVVLVGVLVVVTALIIALVMARRRRNKDKQVRHSHRLEVGQSVIFNIDIPLVRDHL